MVFVVISLATLVFVKLLMVESKQIAPEEVGFYKFSNLVLFHTPHIPYVPYTSHNLKHTLNPPPCTSILQVLELLLVKYDESSTLLCRREQLLSPDRRGQQLISPGGKDPGTPGSDGSFGSPTGAGTGLGGGGGDKVYDSHSMGHSLSISMGDSHNSHNPMIRESVREREDELMGSTV
jgi:hypothetical protein